jgi:endonuclease YncB( thermonuclease family)
MVGYVTPRREMASGHDSRLRLAAAVLDHDLPVGPQLELAGASDATRPAHDLTRFHRGGFKLRMRWLCCAAGHGQKPTRCGNIRSVRHLLLPLAILFLWSAPAFAKPPWIVEGRVVGIADGNTITILDRDKRQHKIPFNGIDAPEKKQPYGQRSRQNLVSLVFNRNVRAECRKRDRYGREVCKVLDGLRDAGIEEVRAGMAWWFRRYANEQSPEDRGRYEAEEREAQKKKVGLWRDPDPVPPWEWRH